MDHSEFDLLEKSVEKALERISTLETENERLKSDRGTLSDQLKSEKSRIASISNRIVQTASPSPDRVAELKARLQKLIETIRDYEKSM
jgi:predicted  nucleic acid-binding Zn-ribbon protein